jgi:outer membrane immunogenic protein
MISHLGLRASALMAGVFAISAPALAADMPVKAPAAVAIADYGWGGLYIGAGVGFRSTTANPTVTSTTNGAQNSATFCPLLIGGCVNSEPMNDTAFRVSPYVGYNWQIDRRWVVGVEGDWGFASRTTTLTGMRYPHTMEFSGTGAPGDSFALKTGWDASLRARGGLLIDPAVMLYATAGIAWLQFETTSVCDTRPGSGPCRVPLFAPVVITNSTTRTGVTVGGGIEAMLWPNWIARAEYRYADFGTASFTDTRAVGATTRITSYDIDLRTHTATFGLAYKLGGAGPAAGALSAFASAAPVPATASWNGFYIGANVGVRSTLVDATTTALTNVATTCSTLQPGSCFTEPLNGSAFRVGPYIGFNWLAAPRWLLGLEADAGWADSTTTLTGMYYPAQNGSGILTGRPADSFAVKTTWDASVRARVGFLARPAVLLYATGGPAWLHIETTSTCSTVAGAGECNPAGFAFSPSVIANATTRTGWTVGGGLEAMLWRNWLVRGEYRYADFGTIHNTETRFDSLGFAQTVSYDLRVRTHTATFGLAYKLDWASPVIARY